MEETQFKVGSKVKIVLDDGIGSVNSVGDEGVITEVGIGKIGFRVHVKGNGNRGNWQLKKVLELI